MRNPFELYDDRRHKDTFVDTSRAEMQLDQLPLQPIEKQDSTSSTSSLKRLRLVGVVLIGVFGILFARLAYLQGFQGKELLRQAEGNRLREHRIIAARGVFFDSAGVQLVKNVPDFTVVIIPKDLPRKDEDLKQTVQKISDHTLVPFDQVNQLVKNTPISQPSATLLEHVEYNTAIQLIVDLQLVPGVRVETGFRRSYTNGTTWSAILGYMGKINADEWKNLMKQNQNYSFDAVIGKAGLESSYEEILKGTDGTRVIEVNAKGKEQSVVSSTSAIPGKNIILSIDSQLQQAAQDSLDKMVSEKESPGGAAIAMDVNTGEILALVTSPTFDNEWFARGITQDEYSLLISDEHKPLFNRAISGEYPSGSTFKPVVSVAGLAEQVITSSTTVLSTGGLKIGESNFPDWKTGGHGVTDVRKALAESVNTFFYLLGGGDNETTTGLGVDRIVAYAKKFGLSQVLKIDLPGERSGFLPSKAWKEEVKNEQWYLGDTYHLAIGQGDILVTPLQVASYTATIANGGTIWRPHIAKAFVSQDGKERTDLVPEALASEVVDDTYLQIVREGMRQAVTQGSARALGVLPWPMAAKTGTAQHGGSTIPHSWLTVFGPYDDPSIVVTVIVEEGIKEESGQSSALPVARDILDFYIKQEIKD